MKKNIILVSILLICRSVSYGQLTLRPLFLLDSTVLLAKRDSNQLFQKKDTNQLLAKRDTATFASGIRSSISQRICVIGTVSLGTISPSQDGSAAFTYGRTIASPTVQATMETATALSGNISGLILYINNKTTTQVQVTVQNNTALTIPITANVTVCQSD